MSINVEARYLDVKWIDEHTVLKIDRAVAAEDIKENDLGYSLESCTFKRYLPRLAFRVLDGEPLHQPYFVISDTKRMNLIAIKDPITQEAWWIESCGWDGKKKQHMTELYRTVGSVNLFIQNKTIKIVNNSLGFSVDELEAYLRDFKNDLWMLILNKDGYIKANTEQKVPNILNAESIRHLEDFIEGVEKIIRNPTIELRETKRILPRRSVRPVNQTFMELASKGNPSHMTSRAYVESSNTPENRYVHHAVNRVHYLVRQIHSIGDARRDLYQRMVREQQARLESISTMKSINEAAYRSEVREIDDKYHVLINRMTDSVCPRRSKRGESELSYKMRLTTPYAGSERAYFCDYLNGVKFKDKYETYLIVTLPEHFCISGLADGGGRVEVELTGSGEKKKDWNNAGKLFYRIIFETITKAEMLVHPLRSETMRMASRLRELETLGWQVPFTRAEQEDIGRERKIIESTITIASAAEAELRAANESVTRVLHRIKKAKGFFADEKIGIESNFPNKMVFVQNPSYALAKAAYSQIAQFLGMDESLFESMSTIAEIGLVNISNLYEKWCLLKIIGIFTEVYGFSIKGEWQKKLITAVSRREYDIEFELESDDLRRSVTLTYEKRLPSGKRPDFVIDVRTHDDDSTRRYVLDAKFKDSLNDDAIRALIDELYSPQGKNYSEDGRNGVFILHATNQAIGRRTSPLSWGEHSDYGQSCGHRFGGVYISPSLKKGRSADNLQRLIGLILEETNEFSCEANEVHVEHNAFCIACGNGDKASLHVVGDMTKGGGEKWSVRCKKCNHLHVDSFCASCREPLKKNGYYWTYHRTRAEQPFNIVCPECQEFL